MIGHKKDFKKYVQCNIKLLVVGKHFCIRGLIIFGLNLNKQCKGYSYNISDLYLPT